MMTRWNFPTLLINMTNQATIWRKTTVDKLVSLSNYGDLYYEIYSSQLAILRIDLLSNQRLFVSRDERMAFTWLSLALSADVAGIAALVAVLGPTARAVLHDVADLGKKNIKQCTDKSIIKVAWNQQTTDLLHASIYLRDPSTRCIVDFLKYRNLPLPCCSCSRCPPLGYSSWPGDRSRDTCSSGPRPRGSRGRSDRTFAIVELGTETGNEVKLMDTYMNKCARMNGPKVEGE